MKTATLPFIRVEPEFCSTVESLRRDAETLTEFFARGIKSLEDARNKDNYVDADIVLDKLRQRLATAKTKAGSGKQ